MEVVDYKRLDDFEVPSFKCLKTGIMPARVYKPFRIDPDLIRYIMSDPFRGLPNEDPYEHIEKFLEIVGPLKVENLTDDALRLRCFVFSLEGAAQQWERSVPTELLTTWDDVVKQFFRRYYPHRKTAAVRAEINNFQQLEGEHVGDAWGRFKEKLRRCPHHEIPKEKLVRTFYFGLRDKSREWLDVIAGGSFLRYTREEAWEKLDEVMDNKWNWENKHTEVHQVFSCSEEKGNLEKKLKKLLEEQKELEFLIKKRKFLEDKEIREENKREINFREENKKIKILSYKDNPNSMRTPSDNNINRTLEISSTHKTLKNSLPPEICNMVKSNSSFEEDPEEDISSEEEDPEEDMEEQPEPHKSEQPELPAPVPEADYRDTAAAAVTPSGGSARLHAASVEVPPPTSTPIGVSYPSAPKNSMFSELDLDSALFSTSSFERRHPIGMKKEGSMETRSQSRKRLGTFNEGSSGSNWRCGSIPGEEKLGSSKSVNWYGKDGGEIEISSIYVEQVRKKTKPRASIRNQGWDFNQGKNASSYEEWLKSKKSNEPKVTIINHRPITRSMTPRLETLHTLPKEERFDDEEEPLEEGEYRPPSFYFGELVDLLSKLRQIDKNNNADYIKTDIMNFMDGLDKGERKMEELDGVQSFEDCRRAIRREKPRNLGDPGPITVPLAIGGFVCEFALCDSGASENIIPMSIFRKLNLAERVESFEKTVTLADNTVIQPRGIVKHVLIRIRDFKYLADFVIIDVEGEKESPITLGRPLLWTTGFILDMRSLAFSVCSGNRKVVFRDERGTPEGNEVVVGLERKRYRLGRRWFCEKGEGLQDPT